MIYGDLYCLLEKMHSCQNNLEKSYTEKKSKHAPSGYSLFANCSFDAAKNKLDCYTSKDDYHFIIKLAKKFYGQFKCLAETTEKYITFSVPFSKKLDNGKTITYKLVYWWLFGGFLKFIDGFRFMSTSLSSLVDNLPEIYKTECKECKEKRKIKSVCYFIGLKINKLSYECK